MKRILIVEDEPLVAMNLEMVVTAIVTSVVVVEVLSRPPRRFYMKPSTLLFWMSM